jgi:hypothetical protein
MHFIQHFVFKHFAVYILSVSETVVHTYTNVDDKIILHSLIFS